MLKRIRRTGDGSHPWAKGDVNNNTTDYNYDSLVSQLDHEKEDVMIWGWEDADISVEDRQAAKIVRKKKTN